MFKILFVSTHSGFYGSNQSLLQLCNGMKRTFDISVLVQRRGLFWRILKENNINIHVIPSFKLVKGNQKYIQLKRFINILILPVLIIIYRIKKYDLIITNSPISYLHAEAAKYASINHLWHVREDLVKHQKCELVGGEDHFKRKLIALSNNRIYSSYALKESYGIDNTQESGHVIYDGVLSRETVVCRKQRNINAPVILFIGSLTIEKGILHACYIVEELSVFFPEITLKLVGTYGAGIESVIRQSYPVLYEKSIISHTEFTLDTQSEYCNADFLLTLSNFEGFGRNVAEAMLRKLFVCGYNTGAIPELINDDMYGSLVNYGDDGNLIKKIVHYVEHLEEYNGIVDRSHNIAIKSFTIEACSEEYVKYVKSIN